MLKLWHHLCIYSRTKWFNYETPFFLFLPFFLYCPVIKNVSHCFTQTFEFISPTSILKPEIIPTFDNFYPPPILTKHPIWYSINTNFFIALHGILYGLHWWHFQGSILFQDIVAHGEAHLVRLLPQHLIPFNTLKTTSSAIFLSFYTMVPSS